MVGLANLYGVVKDHVWNGNFTIKSGRIGNPKHTVSRGSQFRYLSDWVRSDPDSAWLDIEAYNLGKPLQITSLPFLLERNKTEVADGNFLVKSTLKAWDMIKKWEKNN